jgi:excinuclease UvrABC nuclease subunit
MSGTSTQSQRFIFSDIEKVSIPKKPGVYIVYWIKNGKRRIIYRILRDDVLGILYIGSSSNLHRRLKEDLKGDLDTGILQSDEAETMY